VTRPLVGLKLAEKQISTALTNIEATVLHTLTLPVTEITTVERAVAAMAGSVEQVIAQSSVSRQRVTGVGVGLAGVIDAERGVCRYSPILDWRDVPLRQLLEDRTGIPVHIDNDVNLSAITGRLDLTRCDSASVRREWLGRAYPKHRTYLKINGHSQFSRPLHSV
jgi:N-acetylglucosamine repressor